MPHKKDYNLTTLYFPNRITQKLELIFEYPLTIIEAPSGFGKTTAVRTFLSNYTDEGASVYWHTFLGESFQASWKSLCALLAQIDKDSAEKLLNHGTPDNDSIPFITEILENMECEEECYIVLDNFQDAKIPFLKSFLNALGEHGGEKLHVVVLTQQLSQEAMLASRNNHRTYRVTPRDLAFTKDDAAEYYKQAGLRITSGQLDKVYDQCEGWIAALYIQMLAFVQTGDFGSGDIEMLLHTAVWRRLSNAEQEAFLALCIFPSFTRAQSEYMAAPGILPENMLTDNPFIRFDHEMRVFYMHSILKNYLVSRFKDMPAEFRTAVYLRAGDWFNEVNSYVNAMQFYHQAGAYEKIFALPLTSLDVADRVVSENVRPIILDLLDKAELEVKIRYPQSMINIAFALFFMGEHERLMGLRGEIADTIQNCALSENEKRMLAGEMELLVSFLEYNRIDKMSEKHIKAYELIGGASSLININSTWTFGSPSVLYLYHRESGKLEEELKQMDECMPHYYRLTNGHGSGSEVIMRAEAEFFAGNFDIAETLCHKALLVSGNKEQNSIYQCGIFLLARIAIVRGDLDSLQTLQATLRERAKLNYEDLCRYTIDLCEGFLSIILGEPNNIPSWLSQGEMTEKYLSMMVIPFAYIIYGRALLERKEYLKLLGTGEYFMGMASIFPNIMPQIYAKIYMALANDALGKRAEAVEILADALENALPDKLYMPFAENGEALKNLLAEACEKVTLCEGIEKISQLTNAFNKGVRKVKADRPSLSEREQEVYELIANGFTNKEIAKELYISLSTVKTLVSRILEKTGTTSRTQLVGQKKISGF